MPLETLPSADEDVRFLPAGAFLESIPLQESKLRVRRKRNWKDGPGPALAISPPCSLFPPSTRAGRRSAALHPTARRPRGFPTNIGPACIGIGRPTKRDHFYPKARRPRPDS